MSESSAHACLVRGERILVRLRVRVRIQGMSDTQQSGHSQHSGAVKPGEKPPVKIHRVCIGCNNMFEVTMDHVDAKHCSACHKG